MYQIINKGLVMVKRKITKNKAVNSKAKTNNSNRKAKSVLIKKSVKSRAPISAHAKRARKSPVNRWLLAFVSVAVLVLLLILFFPNSLFDLALFKRNSAVLSTDNVMTGGNYSVSEDDLAMFATLAYETPSEVVGIANPFHPGDTAESPLHIRSHYYKDGSITPLITRCKTMVTNTTVETLTEDQKTCLVASRSEYPGQYMYTDNEIVGADYEASFLEKKIDTPSDVLVNIGNNIFTALVVNKNPGQEYYFSGLANIESANQNFLKNWDAVEFFESPTQNPGNDYGKISAVTFKNDLSRDIVIAYRGTDLGDLMDWVAIDGSYGLKNNTKQDEFAKQYALRIGKAYNEGLDPSEQYNIYITGHSLGGYLSQIGGSGLLTLNSNNTVENPYNLKRIVYFNGMGLFASEASKNNNSNNQIATRDKLRAFNTDAATGHKSDRVLFVHSYGDIVSSIGVHYGAYKELKIPNDIFRSQNKFYRMSSGSIFSDICELLNITQKCDETMASSKYKDLSSKTWEYLIPTLNRTVQKSFLNGNVNFSQVTGTIKQQVERGESINGLLPYIMSTHKTNPFFYTTYYQTMMTDSNYIYGPANLYGSGLTEDTDVVPHTPYPSVASTTDSPISYPSSISAAQLMPQTDSLTFGSYGPRCSFKAGVLQTHQLTLPKKPGQIFNAIYMKINQPINGRIICYSENGINDHTIDNGDLIYSDRYWLNDSSFPLVRVRVNNPDGTQTVQGSNKEYYWDVEIVPQKQKWNKSKIRAGIVDRLGLKTGAITNIDAVGNEPAPYPYLIETTNDATKPNPATTPFDTTTPPVIDIAAPICQISIPSLVKANVWPFYKYYDAKIVCSSKTTLVDSTITQSNIKSVPSGRLLIKSISNASVKYENGLYIYSWTVNFRGARASTGSANFKLNANSISNIKKSNAKTTSSPTQVSK